MERYQANSVPQLIDFIGAGNPDSSFSGPVVAEIVLWDKRVVRASYYHGSYETADISVNDSVIMDDDVLAPFVLRLLSSGESFRVLTGESDETCFLEWTIS